MNEKNALEMLMTFRDHIARAIDRGVQRGDAEEWNEMGVVVVDMSSPDGVTIASYFGEGIETSDDGKVATLTGSRARILVALAALGDEDALERALTRPGALVVCMASETDIVTASIPETQRGAFLLFEAMQERVRELIEHALTQHPKWKWKDVGIIVADLRCDFAKQVVTALDGKEPPTGEGKVALVAIAKKDLIQFLRKSKMRGPPKKLPREAALVFCIVDEADAMVAAYDRPHAFMKMDEAHFMEGIQRAIDAGTAKSWSDAALLVLDAETKVGRAMIRELRPGYSARSGGEPVVFVSNKRELQEMLGLTREEVGMDATALVAVVKEDRSLVLLRYAEPTTH